MGSKRGKGPPNLPIRFGNWGESKKAVRVMVVGGPRITNYFRNFLGQWANRMVFQCSPERMREQPTLWLFSYRSLEQACFFLEAGYEGAHEDFIETHAAGPVHVLATQVRFHEADISFVELIGRFLQSAPFYPRLFLLDHEGDSSLQDGMSDWIQTLGHEGLDWSIGNTEDQESLLRVMCDLARHLNHIFGVNVPFPGA